jgi:hypothetical protein
MVRFTLVNGEIRMDQGGQLVHELFHNRTQIAHDHGRGEKDPVAVNHRPAVTMGIVIKNALPWRLDPAGLAAGAVSCI